MIQIECENTQLSHTLTTVLKRPSHTPLFPSHIPGGISRATLAPHGGEPYGDRGLLANLAEYCCLAVLGDVVRDLKRSESSCGTHLY